MDFSLWLSFISLGLNVLCVSNPSAYSRAFSHSHTPKVSILLFTMLALVHVYVKYISTLYVVRFKHFLFLFFAFQNFLERIFIWSFVFPFVVRYACSVFAMCWVQCCVRWLSHYCAMAVLYAACVCMCCCCRCCCCYCYFGVVFLCISTHSWLVVASNGIFFASAMVWVYIPFFLLTAHRALREALSIYKIKCTNTTTQTQHHVHIHPVYCAAMATENEIRR